MKRFLKQITLIRKYFYLFSINTTRGLYILYFEVMGQLNTTL